MTDYIKRTDAVKIAEKYGLANGSVLGRHTGLADCIARDISDLPAADVAEVRHGRWSSNGIALVCSECGKSVNLVEMFAHYCPYCGTRMDKEAEHDVD